MDKFLENLEFNKILEIIATFTISKTTQAKVKSLIYPKTDKDSAQILLDECEEAYNLYHVDSIKPLVPFDDTSECLAKSKVFAMLSLKEIRKVFFLLRAGRVAKESIISAENAILLKNYVFEYNGDNKLENDIESWIISDTEISDNASTKLKEIRKKLVDAKIRLNNKVKKYSRSYEISKYLQDDLVTIRDGRYVLPVKSEYRSFVAGLIHDRSDTGATLFIEPYTIVESNNEIKSLEIEEQQEIERIIKGLTERIALIVDDLDAMQNALVKLDAIFAKAHFSAAFDATKPKLNDKGFIKLIKSRHPLINKSEVVPVTIELGRDYKILMITGPNTGGKTVALKTVGLFSLLAASGIFLPAAQNSQIAIFDKIYSVIGDEQSITSSLSTFSSHIKNLVSVLDNATNDSLVLLDELCSGTDPDEGAALAIGIIKYLERIGCSGIITTHYGQLKEYALESKNIQNASMQFDNVSLRPTFRLVSGLAGTSNALKIAKTLGINDFVINSAYESLSEEKKNFEKLLSTAQEVKNQSLTELENIKKERQEIEKLKEELESDRKKLKERLQKVESSAKAEIRRLVSNSMDTAAELIEQIKEQVKIADQGALLRAKQLMKKIEDIKYQNQEYSPEKRHQPVNPNQLKEGMEVLIISLDTLGRIIKLSPDKKQASVQAGAFISNIKYDNLALPPKEKPQDKVENIKSSNIKNQNTLREINVIGKTVSEATYEIDNILLAMAATGEKILRIIHGKGTGALGKGIQIFLRHQKQVKSYRYGKYGEGETGVTIVELK